MRNRNSATRLPAGTGAHNAKSHVIPISAHLAAIQHFRRISMKLTPLRIDRPEPALSKEQKTFNSRMQQIEKLRARLAAWDEATIDYQREYTAKLIPLLDRAFKLEVNLAHTLDRTFAFKGLTKTERHLLQEIVCELTAELLEEVDDPDLKALYNKHGRADYDVEERQRVDGMKDLFHDMFGIDLGADGKIESMDDLIDRAHARLAQEAQRAQAGEAAREEAQTQTGSGEEKRARRKKSARQQEREVRAAAEAKATDLSIRDIYRKLASALHPDREPDPAERERKTALMQRINQAYDRRDLLQLLELQLELEHIDRDHLARLSEDRLRHYNAVLKDQIDELKGGLLRVEYEFRMRFGIDPFARLKPETVLRDLADDVRAMQRQIREHERELSLLGDVKGVRSWLKEMRLRRIEDDFDFDEPPFF